MPFDSKLFTKFINDNQKKVLNFLKNRFNVLSKDDVDDIFQEASVALYNSILKGRPQDEVESLSHYFMGICFNQANKFIRDRKSTDTLDEGKGYDDTEGEIPTTQDNYDMDKVDELLGLFDEDSEDREAIFDRVRDIVKSLPHPCNELLWDYYESGFSMKEIALMYNYADSDVAKQTKSRCMRKFANNYKG